jgi:hypothetical protein
VRRGFCLELFYGVVMPPDTSIEGRVWACRLVSVSARCGGGMLEALRAWPNM